MELLTDVHRNIPSPSEDIKEVIGTYHYFHYGCDGMDDRGWGCGYRTLQTLCSWVRGQLLSKGQGQIPEVPSLKKIQEMLVNIGDKSQCFIGSKNWIGSVEVGLVLDTLYDVPCKIVHIPSGSDLKDHIPQLIKHFQEMGSPAMMGGNSDSSSKGVVGVGVRPDSLAILDPHFYGTPTLEQLHHDKWIVWRTLDTFDDNSFYNLCLPQLKAVTTDVAEKG